MTTVLEANVSANLSKIKALINNVESLDTVSFSAVPELALHINNAKQVCKSWGDETAPALETSLTLILSLVNDWNTKYLVELNSLIIEKPVAKDKIKTLLKELSARASAAKLSASTSSSKTKLDDSNLAAAMGNINSDAAKLNAKIQADQASINSLNDQISHAQSKINDYKKREKIYKWIPGWGWLAGAIDKLVSHIGDYEDEVKKDIAIINGDSGEMNKLSSVINTISKFISALQIVTASFVSLEESLDNLGGNLTDLLMKIDTIEEYTFSVWIKAELHSLSEDFEQINSIVTKLCA